MNKPSFGVVVGRFQVHELHDGHMELFRIVKGRHNRIIVFLGCTKSGPTRHDPLDFETRKKMIQAKFPDFTVLPLQDKITDAQWSKEVDARIEDAVGGVPAEIVLYGSRKSFTPHYSGNHKVKELDIEVPASVSSTDIREKLTNEVMADPKFRAGIIYAMSQLFPRTIPCVDIAILHRDSNNEVWMLLGYKKEDNGLRFVGGHAMLKNISYEHDAAMEVSEETGLSVWPFEYVASARIHDWRWRSEPTEGIKSILYMGWSMTMGGHADSDLDGCKWVKVAKLSSLDFDEVHRELWEKMRTHPRHEAWGIPSEGADNGRDTLLYEVANTTTRH